MNQTLPANTLREAVKTEAAPGGIRWPQNCLEMGSRGLRCSLLSNGGGKGLVQCVVYLVFTVLRGWMVVVAIKIIVS